MVWHCWSGPIFAEDCGDGRRPQAAVDSGQDRPGRK